MFGVFIGFPANPQAHDIGDGEVYLAGERVAPGVYRQIEIGREVCLDHEDVLPASLDGRVACYERVLHTWDQLQQQREESLPV